MRSTFYGLEISKTGLFIAQQQLDVTGHNMSNTNTVGYTRQYVSTQALPPVGDPTFIAVDRRGLSGRGVETLNINQIRNPFLDYQYRKENAVAYTWTAKEQYFGNVEALFNGELEKLDSTTGMTKMFANFYTALNELQTDVSNTSLRENVVKTAQQLTESMNSHYTRLMDQQNTLDEAVRISVEEVNDIAYQIAALNKQIYSFEMNGARANDLRDQRNVLLDTLSGIVNMETREDGNGQLTVLIDGKALVRHDETSTMLAVADVPNPVEGGPLLYGIYWADKNGDPITSRPIEIENGALRGYMDIRDGDAKTNVGVPYIIHQLDELCRTIAKDFNEIHQKGWTIPTSSTANSLTNVEFFDTKGDLTTVRAKDFSLSQLVLDDPRNIACSSDQINKPGEENTQQTNNKNLLELIALVNKRDDVTTKPDNFDTRYQTILTLISTEQNRNITNAKAQNSVRDQVDEQRVSVSGVSVDEEMTNLIRFNHAYQASSRMITAIDEILDILINRMGLVGRS